ncbi:MULTISPECIES: hypothetical protein [unclassified Pseudomonas]|uniref:hypothetical protein n=1 Tax=unclassified Pseudomonas TaxID=196821 RepID=UPI000C86D53D|nr:MULTISPECIES: hypothetical protein [unclassified Pseudomonas]PMV80872.1 hypothetical protein C1X56_30215 [Pseudomonas sp. GW101-1A09]PMV88299.1 hypothetical protein C1X51_26690 [Pseudomonas sp. FW306-2-2C-B10A]PMW02555.1 hypothetical protein C1X55_03080 [Pseudomonas sp. GW460-C8]PMW05158.1 hypothetical protein C1X50_14090 [Pseudomonas sp. MPR-TSA4]PMW09463.1 hypothetical protein C1X52_25420 [Pseudomonas sp. FW306-2-1A-C05A]
MTDTQTSTDTTAEKDTPPAVELPWADVHVEHHKMLRLAPLQTDRNTGGRPLRFVEFGYADRHSKDHSLMRMSIKLPGQRVRKEQNHLDVWVDHTAKRVHFEPESGLQIEPMNRGIGRFMATQGITWAKKRWPGYTIDGTDLNNKDALNEDTRLRRDHFLKAHGFEVVYADAQHLKGSVKEVKVEDLLGDWNSEKLQVVEILEAAQMLQQAEQNLAEQEVKLKKHEEKVSKYKREDAGLRFTITCLVAFAVFQAGLLIWIATHR